MALLGTGANVQCTGYFPGYYSTRDLMFRAEGSTLTSSNCNGELKSDSYLNGSLPALSPTQFLGYYRELLKQTMLKHEAIFRDQIHDLHRLYQKQRELMDEIKRNELYKHNLSLETSWSSSTRSRVLSKNDQKTCCSPSLPWLTGQSSLLMAESIQLPLHSVQENNGKLCLAPVPTEGYAKDPQLSELKCRKVGKKILDLQLPADEYIDSEDESLEDDGFCKVPKPSLGSNGANSNDYEDLNALVKLEGKVTAKTDDLVGYSCLKNIPSRDLSNSTKLGSQNLSNDVILNPKKGKDIDACSDDLPLKQEKKHGPLFYINAGQNGMEKLSVSSEIFSKKPDHPCFLDQINQGAWSGRKFSNGESSVGAQGTIDGLVGPNSPLRTCSPYQLVSMGDTKGSVISPAVLWERPTVDLGQSPIAVQAFPSFGTSTPLCQSSISFMGMPGFSRDELYHCTSIKSGPNLDRSNFLLNSFCSGSKTSDPPLISTNDVNSPDKHGASHELKKYAKHSEDVRTPKNVNLNIMPFGCSDVEALQSNQVTDEENKFQDLERGLPWLKEKRALRVNPTTEESKNSTHIEPVLSQLDNLEGFHGFELKKVGDNDLSREKILVHDINGQPRASSDMHSSHAVPSYKNCSENRNAGKIEESCVSDVKVPCNHVTELAEMTSPGEHIKKNELEKKHKGLASHIDLNSCMDEDESMPIDIDLQAPVSPENKECSPPRGESDENQLEMSYRLVGLDNPEVLEEQVRIAAGSLVSISASVAYNGHQMTSCPPSESSASDSLHWFAGIVSSMMDYRENGVKEGFFGNTDDLEELLPAGFDYFEAMTLKLKETKVLNCCCCKSSDQNEEEGGSTSSTQPRNGRTNRGRRRKDFQGEILPSLASLSRYEVTEDLQTIGGLMEAAGTHLATGSLRSAGRNVLARGGRRSFTSSSNISDLLLKQLTDKTESGIEKSGLISWGKKTRKRRGQRYPARNPSLF
ncbi:hypothetical protein L6164_014534 [Bauhinia variegata]|uniref:Uncharacterized protein n=1 Tax=Bauhinia variegata TaxID=167791 RepID=A0ACB9NIH5_BAUVA|nr:hypothetical protein L6164_014534 [Bauhinia variegata]